MIKLLHKETKKEYSGFVMPYVEKCTLNSGQIETSYMFVYWYTGRDWNDNVVSSWQEDKLANFMPVPDGILLGEI